MTDRREFLKTTSMATFSLFLPNHPLAQTGSVSATTGLGTAYGQIAKDFSPRVSVGNVCGRVVRLPVFETLAKDTPGALLSSFDQAVTTLNSKRLNVASDDYVEFRISLASGDFALSTVEISGDVQNDYQIVVLISQTFSRDLAVGKELLENDALPVSVFRQQMEVLRDQFDLVEAEERRITGGGLVYIPVKSKVSRNQTSETEQLKAEIDRLRMELANERKLKDELAKFVLEFG